MKSSRGGRDRQREREKGVKTVHSIQTWKGRTMRFKPYVKGRAGSGEWAAEILSTWESRPSYSHGRRCLVFFKSCFSLFLFSSESN